MGPLPRPASPSHRTRDATAKVSVAPLHLATTAKPYPFCFRSANSTVARRSSGSAVLMKE
eukprot:2218709-Heterocapsa_arctica.AAC.1